jgi:metallo-beta-lactamase family protein
VPLPVYPDGVARLDWHNNASRLLLDISDALAATADERSPDVIIRRLRRALEDNPG